MSKQDLFSALKEQIAPSLPLRLELAGGEGGKAVAADFRLTFDFNAVARIQEMTGYEVLNGEIWKHLTPRNIIIIFWALILAHHPEFDSEEGRELVGSLINPGNADQVAVAIVDAYILSLPLEKQAAMRAMKEKALGGEVSASPLAAPETPPPAS